MAQRVITMRVSDLSGEDLGDGGQTVNFSIGSDQYTIDLSDKEAEKFFDTLKKYTDVATKTGGRGVRGGRRSSGGQGSNAKFIREWAAQNGIDVPARGRIPESIREQYEASVKA